ncbi:MAG TPA: hypothetical protein VMZ92_20985 [Planctomycetota bacterium]|nr:hypothetical protein [Planctomycetota bacterium]HUX16954.1 hypothetical protein [Phycisphaerae bacterium]
MAIVEGNTEALDAMAAAMPDHHMTHQPGRGPVLAADSHALLDFGNQPTGDTDPNHARRRFGQVNRELARRWRQELDQDARDFWTSKNLQPPPHHLPEIGQGVLLTTWPGFRDFYFAEVLCGVAGPLAEPGEIAAPDVYGMSVPRWNILDSTFDDDGFSFRYKPGTADGDAPRANGLFWYQIDPNPPIPSQWWKCSRLVYATWDLPVTTDWLDATVPAFWDYAPGEFASVICRLRNGYRYVDTLFVTMERT